MENVNKSRLNASYASVVVSISLVLFLLALLGVMLLNAKKVTDEVRENFAFTVFLKNSSKKIDVRNLQKSLELTYYVKSTEYISKDEAANKLKKELGEDFVSFLGYNPLKNSIDVHLKAEYVHPDYMKEIEGKLSKRSIVEEVIFDKLLIKQMSMNIDRVSFWLSISSMLFLLVVMALINSSIRLSVHAKRFTIKTMQLVGATKGFIRKPFVYNNIKLGLLGAFISLSVISILLYYLQYKFPILDDIQDVTFYVILYVVVIIMGIIISWISTYFAMNKYLRSNIEDLY